MAFSPNTALTTRRDRPALDMLRISRYPSGMTKILVTIDDRLLASIDRSARAAGLSRSAYLSRLAARDLGLLEGPGRSAPVRRSLKALDKLFRTNPTEGDAATLIRSERDSH